MQTLALGNSNCALLAENRVPVCDSEQWVGFREIQYMPRVRETPVFPSPWLIDHLRTITKVTQATLAIDFFFFKMKRKHLRVEALWRRP